MINVKIFCKDTTYFSYMQINLYIFAIFYAYEPLGAYNCCVFIYTKTLVVIHDRFLSQDYEKYLTFTNFVPSNFKISSFGVISVAMMARYP